MASSPAAGLGRIRRRRSSSYSPHPVLWLRREERKLYDWIQDLHQNTLNGPPFADQSALDAKVLALDKPSLDCTIASKFAGTNGKPY